MEYSQVGGDDGDDAQNHGNVDGRQRRHAGQKNHALGYTQHDPNRREKGQPGYALAEEQSGEQGQENDSVVGKIGQRAFN